MIDAANILPGVSAAEIVAARPVEAARRRGILGGAATRVTIVAGGDSRSRMVESIVSDVVDHRRRTLLDVVVASEVERFRGADVAIIPPAADGTRAWMLASLAGAAAIVDVEIEHAVEPGRTALVARSDTEWTVNLTRLLDDPVLRTSLAYRSKAGGDAAARAPHRGCLRRQRDPRCQRFAERHMTAAGYNRCVRSSTSHRLSEP